MNKQQANKVTSGTRVRYKPNGELGTVHAITTEHHDPRVKLPLFSVQMDNGELEEITYKLLEVA